MSVAWPRAALPVALLVAALSGCSAGGPQTCRIGRIVDLKLLAGIAQPAVEASLDGQKVVVLIDTGAAVSVIDRNAAQHFYLQPGPEGGRAVMTGIGGSFFAPIVSVPHLMLGHGIARDLELPVAGSLGGPIAGLPVLGLFGADFLSNYDVDLDVPDHHFAMYRMTDCGSTMQPLAPPEFSMPFTEDDTKVVLDVKLNGKPVTAFLDSGAAHTLVSLATARAVGVDRTAMTSDRVVSAHGIDERELATTVHRFGSLQVGDEAMNNFRFGIADSEVGDMLLGDDFLRFNHVWISYRLHRLYVHPVLPDALRRS